MDASFDHTVLLDQLSSVESLLRQAMSNYQECVLSAGCDNACEMQYRFNLQHAIDAAQTVLKLLAAC